MDPTNAVKALKMGSSKTLSHQKNEGSMKEGFPEGSVNSGASTRDKQELTVKNMNGEREEVLVSNSSSVGHTDGRKSALTQKMIMATP